MRSLASRCLVFLLVFGFVSTPVSATCGVGGGGGGGGMSGSSGNGGGSKPVVYHVPWKASADPKAKPVTEGLVLYWFPASKAELQSSSLRESRNLSVYAGQCVAMQLADVNTPKAAELIGDSKLPIAVLAEPDGTSIKKLENVAGKLKVADVEKLVSGEINARGTALDAKLTDGKAKASAGDNAGAIAVYKEVVAAKCMFPKKAKEATAALKKLGEQNIGAIPDAPDLSPAVTAKIVQTMRTGLIAENAGKYLVAEKYYAAAHKMDLADPTPLRYLAELNRHHIGDWDKAKVEFHQLLDMPNADPLSRAVALHGLGKITIHEGEFKKGLGLMEQSVDAYPIALAYRNLAVYWVSEYDRDKGSYYIEKALAMDPQDPYNVIFAAVFMAGTGKKAEALAIAKQNINLMPASYNLAAIFAQNGDKAKALELLKRHFYQYERYHAVREKEMMEARVDGVFDSIRHDAGFMELTKFADGKLPMRMSPRQVAEPAMRMNF